MGEDAETKKGKERQHEERRDGRKEISGDHEGST
jgi:hypothetical protein